MSNQNNKKDSEIPYALTIIKNEVQDVIVATYRFDFGVPDGIHPDELEID